MTINKRKIFNDPVYGFITIPDPLIFELIEHPYFQRLRRIKQLGLTDFVYPGAHHTRFHHALGALHLMQQAIETLRSKSVDISEEEALGSYVAILLHDIGHAPFSHALENIFSSQSHEEISLMIIRELNQQFDQKLETAIRIYTNSYPKRFFHQLVSSQIDMDRMDYLNRDSFFSGVAEGIIGYDRIIKMLDVVDDQLVVEEKGLYSIEKFLLARRFMYWQVYLHKTVIAAEQMLSKCLKLIRKESHLDWSPLLQQLWSESNLKKSEFITSFCDLDDVDIVSLLKSARNSKQEKVAFLANSLLNRNLFKTEFSNTPFQSDQISKLRKKVVNNFGEHMADLMIKGHETVSFYQGGKNEIKVLLKNKLVTPLSLISDHNLDNRTYTKYYICYPHELSN